MASRPASPDPVPPAFNPNEKASVKVRLMQAGAALLVLLAAYWIYGLVTDVPGVKVENEPPQQVVDMLPPPPPSLAELPEIVLWFTIAVPEL